MPINSMAEQLVGASDPSVDSAPAVSVVVPAYDVWPWITDCLSSILHEDRIPLEVIVVDDGSTDETVEIVTEIARQDQRVRLIRSTGVGGGQARNIGARVARSDYVMFCDADDVVAPEGILRMHQAAVLTRADMVVGNFLKFSAAETWSTTEHWDLFTERRENITLSDAPALIRNRSCWNRLFSRAFWEREAIRFPTVPRSNDIVPMTIALTQATRITIIPEIVYLYRQRPGNGSMTARATSIVGTLSYLRQEEICRAVVTSLNDDTVKAAYWAMLLDSDAWMQSTRYMQHLESGGSRSFEVEEAIRSIVTERRHRSWARVRAERQAIYSLISAGDSHGAVHFWRDFRSRSGDIDAALIDRGVQAIDHVIQLGDITHEAASELYTQLVLVPIQRMSSPEEVARTIERAQQCVRHWDVSVRLRSPAAALLELHAALTGQDARIAKQTAAKRTIEAPRVEAITVGPRDVTVDLRTTEGGDVVLAEVRSVSETRRVRVSRTTSGASTIMINDSEIDSSGTWHVWAKIRLDGVESWREVLLEREDLVPPPMKFGRFVIRWPTMHQRLIILRRPAMGSRITGRLKRSLGVGSAASK